MYVSLLLLLMKQWLLTDYSYDSFKIFMGLPTTGGGPAPEKKQQ